MARLNARDWTALVFVIVGGLNWGLIGLFSFDLVAAIFGTMSWLTRLIYLFVAAAALYLAYIAPKLGRDRPH